MATRASATDMIPVRRRQTSRCCMAAILAPPGACFPAPPNLSSTSRPGSIPIPIRCRDFRPICSPACRMPPPCTRSPRRPRGPTARRRRRMSCRRRARRFCCRWSPAWCRQAGRPFWRRPMPNMPAPPRLPDTGSKRCAASTRAATPALVIVANPNNPDGRLFARARSCSRLPRIFAAAAACSWSTRRSWMSGRRTQASRADVACGNIVVLRSFGKFFGLAGLRLGFALAAPALAARLRAALGPWAVSGPALAVGTQALADAAWIERTRRRLDKASARLDGILSDLALSACRRHELVPAGADAGSGRALPASGERRHLGARLSGQRELAALRPAGERAGSGSGSRAALVCVLVIVNARRRRCAKTGQLRWHLPCSPSGRSVAPWCADSGKSPSKTRRARQNEGGARLNSIGTPPQGESGVNQSSCRKVFGLAGRSHRPALPSVLSVTTLTSAHAGGVGILSCVGGARSFNCAAQWGHRGDPYVRGGAGSSWRGGEGASRGARSQMAGHCRAGRRARPLRCCPLPICGARLRIRRRRGLMLNERARQPRGACVLCAELDAF